MQKTECVVSRTVGITPEQPSASLWVCREGLQPDRRKKTTTKKKKKTTPRELLSLVLKCLLVFLALSSQPLSFFF